MNLVTAIIVLLAQHGYWVGGQEYPVNFAWTVRANPPPATVRWTLLAGEVRLAEGQMPLPGNGAEGATLTLRAPEVRVPTQLTLRYTVRTADAEGRELCSGSEPIRVFPPIDLKPLAGRLGERELAVWDADDGLPLVLSAQTVPHRRLENISDLLTTRADLILVGPDRLDDEQALAILRDQAARGASIMIFRQSRIGRLQAYRLARRPGTALRWRTEHPLLSDLPAEAWQSLIGAEEIALEVPVDHPALELAFYPPEVHSAQPLPLDALLLTQTIGNGRIVFCQLAAGDWSRDPRSQALLRSTLQYLLMRPVPTPPPSQRLSPSSQPVPDSPDTSKDQP